MTLEIARLVAPALATGIDMDGVKIDLARDAAAKRGVTNVRFQTMNLHDWHEHAYYDFVYTRFVLQHLSEPVDMLRRMWEAVRPGGLIVVEDADFDGWTCHPRSAGFDFFTRTYAEVISRAGGDHALGRKLYSCFLEAGIGKPEISATEPVYIEGEAKSLPWTTLDATADLIIAESIASRDELEAALMDLKRITNDPESLIAGPRIFQLWRQREV